MENKQGWGNTQFRPTWGRPTAPPSQGMTPGQQNPSVSAGQAASLGQSASVFRPFATRPPRSARLAALKEEADARLSQYGSAGFQVVRSAFFATQYDPSITIHRYSVNFNSACINSLETATYVKFMVDADAHRLMIKPCLQGAKGAVRWCNAKRKSRRISCRELTDRLYALMNWPDEYRFRLQGVETMCMGERVYYFNLDDRQAFAPTRKDPQTGKKVMPRGEFPEEWKGSFGLSEEETDAPVHFFAEEESGDGIGSFSAEGGQKDG